MSKIKLGIIGCGMAAEMLHLPALKKLKNKYEITAVCNHTKQKAQKFSDMLGGIPYYLDYKKFLREADINGVDITLPIDLNYKVTTEAVKWGKHVIVEKPLAANLREGKKLLELDKKTKLTLMVAENFRYRKVFNQCKKLLDNRIIGKPYSVIWNLFYNVNEKEGFARTKWRQKHNYIGGFLLDAGVHNIAALRYLFGDFKSGWARKRSVNNGIGTHDTMSYLFELENGMMGTYNIFFTVMGLWKDQLIIFGEKGTIEILMDQLIIHIEGKRPKLINCEDDHGYIGEFTNFYNSIMKGEKILSNFKEGYKDLKTIISAIKSSSSGKREFV